MSSANKTKEWLKTQLVNHGVQLPAASAKKEEYQRLYDEQVRPRQNNTEFSSDDDTEETSIQETPTRSPSVPNSRPQNGTDGTIDRLTQWVQRLSDASLFTALKANGREVGGIVESTRVLYQRVLTEMLKTDERKTMSEIDNYLSQNKEAKDLWLQNGVELNLNVNGGFNGVTNGNSENGFSDDTDDDETVETASRASRSSRASSKRMTPVRTSAAAPPAKETTPQRSVVDSHIRSRRGGSRDDALVGINEVDEDHGTASSSRSTLSSESALFNRVSSPADSYRFNKPYTVRKTVVETVEKLSTHHYFDDNSEESTEPKQRSSPPKTAGRSRAMVAFKYIGLLIAVVVIPVLAYYLLGLQEKSTNCVGTECSSDELDVLLQSLDEQDPGVQNVGSTAGEA